MSYYEVFNLMPSASMIELEEMYEKIKKTEENTNDIDKAYRTLINYHSRREYDDQLDKCSNNQVLPNNKMSQLSSQPKDIFNDVNNFGNMTEVNMPILDNWKDVRIDDSKLIQENNIEKYMLNINKKLESIENNLKNITNKTNYYREKKNIETIFKDGCKKITITTTTNDNGIKNITNKVIKYDKFGKKRTYYNSKLK
tara:strand:+ start:378 stop:971 length:594 start_codon:yes stop_codon:yes gene_type:complete